MATRAWHPCCLKITMESGHPKIRQVESLHPVAKERALATVKVVIISKIETSGKVGAAILSTPRAAPLIEVARSEVHK